MKKIILASFSILSVTILNAQSTSTFNGGWTGGTVTVDFSGLRRSGNGSSGGGSGSSQDRYYSERQSSPAIPSSEVVKNMYNHFAAEAYSKAVEAWNKRDWDAVIKHCNTAHAYNKDNQTYVETREKARGYKEWDKGVEEADKENYDKAIDRFKKSLEYFPENVTLKTNIIICARNKTTDQAEKAYNSKDWISAAVYYNVLWKNFDDNSAEVQAKYSECLSKIEKMKKVELAHTKFDAMLAKVKAELEAKNINW